MDGHVFARTPQTAKQLRAALRRSPYTARIAETGTDDEVVDAAERMVAQFKNLGAESEEAGRKLASSMEAAVTAFADLRLAIAQSSKT